MEQSADPLVFLVISSAVANISFMGSVVYEYLAQQGAAGVLVEGWRGGKVDTLNAKDQVGQIYLQDTAWRFPFFILRNRYWEVRGIMFPVSLLLIQVHRNHTTVKRQNFILQNCYVTIWALNCFLDVQLTYFQVPLFHHAIIFREYMSKRVLTKERLLMWNVTKQLAIHVRNISMQCLTYLIVSGNCFWKTKFL